MGWISYLHFIN